MTFLHTFLIRFLYRKRRKHWKRFRFFHAEKDLFTCVMTGSAAPASSLLFRKSRSESSSILSWSYCVAFFFLAAGLPVIRHPFFVCRRLNGHRKILHFCRKAHRYAKAIYHILSLFIQEYHLFLWIFWSIFRSAPAGKTAIWIHTFWPDWDALTWNHPVSSILFFRQKKSPEGESRTFQKRKKKGNCIQEICCWFPWLYTSSPHGLCHAETPDIFIIY